MIAPNRKIVESKCAKREEIRTKPRSIRWILGLG